MNTSTRHEYDREERAHRRKKNASKRRQRRRETFATRRALVRGIRGANRLRLPVSGIGRVRPYAWGAAWWYCGPTIADYYVGDEYPDYRLIRGLPHSRRIRDVYDVTVWQGCTPHDSEYDDGCSNCGGETGTGCERCERGRSMLAFLESF